MTFDSIAYSFSAESETESSSPFLSRRSIAHVENPHKTVEIPDVSRVETHLETAQLYFEQNNIDGAVDELAAAAERLKAHHNMVHASMNSAIAFLSTMGCRATPPHPKAISLVKIRKSLPA